MIKLGNRQWFRQPIPPVMSEHSARDMRGVLVIFLSQYAKKSVKDRKVVPRRITDFQRPSLGAICHVTPP